MCSAICAGEQAGCVDHPDPEAALVVEAVVVEYTNSAVFAAIDEHIHSERDRAILKRRLIDGLTFERLAEEFNLSVRRTKTIVYKGQERIFSHM